MRDGLLTRDHSFLDYGCGRGDDFRRLSRQGFDCEAWDPVHRPRGAKRKSDVVNLGYVVNVIENPRERVETLKEAWGLADSVLVVSARLENEAPSRFRDALNDGIVTARGTFQKFYDQQELRNWIDSTLSTKSVPAAPGIFYVFLSAEAREVFVASKFRRNLAAPRVRRSDQLFEAHRDLLEALSAFLNDRGRLPDAAELDSVPEIEKKFGSLRRAFSVIERVTGVDDWRVVREKRASELLIYLALARFSGRPRASELPFGIKLDVKAFFGSYKAACTEADGLLYSAGDLEKVNQAAKEAGVGKRTSPALYVHESALSNLPALLRVYEGCARAYLGTVEEANLIKLHRSEPRVSYLSYPDFERDPHPALENSLTVHLQTFRLRDINYSERDNPPVLHRKEEFVAEGFPGREKFARLTKQEERHGLFEEPTRIGTRSQWGQQLQEKGLVLRGHRLVRSTEQQEEAVTQ